MSEMHCSHAPEDIAFAAVLLLQVLILELANARSY